MIQFISDDDELVAAWEALLLPDWRWEALEKEDDNLYYGRVRSPKTRGEWEYGYFSREQLEEAGAYRVDTKIGGEEPLFPDGGYRELTKVYETEFNAWHYLDEEGENHR